MAKLIQQIDKSRTITSTDQAELIIALLSTEAVHKKNDNTERKKYEVTREGPHSVKNNLIFEEDLALHNRIIEQLRLFTARTHSEGKTHTALHGRGRNEK